MISIKNYFEQAKAIDFSKLPDKFQSFHSTMELLAEDYNEDKEIHEAIEVYLKALNAELSKQTKAEPKKENPAPKLKPEKKSKSVVGFTDLNKAKAKAQEDANRIKKPVYVYEDEHRNFILSVTKLKDNKLHFYDTYKPKKLVPVKKSKKANTKPAKPTTGDPKLVGHIDPIVAIAKRFLGCEGKVRTVGYMLNFLAHVEKQIISETITKKAANYSLVKTIEKELQTIIRATIDAGRDEVLITTFSDEKRAKYLAVANSQKVRPSVNVIKRFTGIAGKKDKQESAERLLKTTQNLIKKNPKDKHVSKLRKIKTSLTNYVGGQKPIPVDDVSLAGLKVLPASQLANMNFKELGVTGIWKEVLGAVTVPFSIMMYGRPGSGKSTFSIKFAAYLAKTLSKRVLYIAAEEGFSATLQDKFNRMNAFHDNIDIVQHIPSDLSKYAVVFIDSVNHLGLSHEELENMITINKAKNISFVFVFRGTKDGTFRGEETYENLVDCSIKIEEGKTLMMKNRFGGAGEMKIF